MMEETETVTLKNVHAEKHVVEGVSEERYLGDIISKDGKLACLPIRFIIMSRMHKFEMSLAHDLNH